MKTRLIILKYVTYGILVLILIRSGFSFLSFNFFYIIFTVILIDLLGMRIMLRKFTEDLEKYIKR